MLSRADNELLCRVGPGTPMGELMRQYWVPCLPSSEFPEPDGEIKRMMLLGEPFVMFRDTDGKIGAMVEACPHRGASLYFGRNEGCGVRCNYHGWKFDRTGNLVDVPTERPGSRAEAHFKETVSIRAYPCHEVNHMIWIYMGPRKTPPPFPEFEINLLPADHVAPPSIMMEEANWLQNIEGDLDSVHLDHVHRRLAEDAPNPPLGMPGFWNNDPNPPRLDVERTEWGAFYTSMRMLPDGRDWHRINNFVFPFHTTISVGPVAVLRSFVPLDDHHAMLVHQMASVEGPFTDAASALGPDSETVLAEDSFAAVGGYLPRSNDPRSYFMTFANKRNDYLRDRTVEKESMRLGVPFVLNLQDRAMTELMCGADGEPLYDRTQEHLGSSDQMIIAVRAQLLAAVKALRDDGALPPNVDDVSLDHVRSASLILEPDVDWRTLSADARSSDSGRPVSADVPLIIEART
jgi:nitrite reductase/ring-hydroxylating ferredoxin subunit